MSKILAALKTFFFTEKNIYIFIIAGMLFFIFYKKSDPTPVIVKDQQKIDSLNIRVSSLEDEIKSLSPKLDSNNKRIDSVKAIVKSNVQQVKNVQVHAKMVDSVLGTYTSDQLKKYFSDY